MSKQEYRRFKIKLEELPVIHYTSINVFEKLAVNDLQLSHELFVHWKSRDF